MKKTIILACAAVMSLAACKKDKASLLKGEWILTDIELDLSDTINMTPAEKAREIAEYEQFMQGFNTQKDSMKLTLRDSSSYTFAQAMGKVDGKWTLLPNDTVIEFIAEGFEHEPPQHENIRLVNDEKLHLYDSIINGVMIFKRAK